MSARRWRLLVVDDDPLIVQSLRLVLPSTWEMCVADSLETLPSTHFDAAFVDLHLTALSTAPTGLTVMQKLSEIDPSLEIVAISGDLSREIMEQTLRAGATRFLPKPLTTEEVLLTLSKIEAHKILSVPSQHPLQHTHWLGQGPASMLILRRIGELKGEPGPILIEGETGTGKEVTAFLLHHQESNRPWISINVAAIPDELFESEFFGHVKGAFTGADQHKLGLAEAAHGGDLFLDEIEALPLHHQAKLLRFLESGEVRRVGGRDTFHVNVRIIAATNRNLQTLVEEQKFREDLLWRLSGKTILLPPLRERKEDLETLATHFLSLERPRRNKSLSSDALAALKSYSWPGNVRELKRVIEQVSLLSPLPIIRGSDIQNCLPKTSTSHIPSHEINFAPGLTALMSEYEKYIIQEALNLTTDIDQTAELLRISRSNLYKKIKDHQLNLKSET